MLTVVLLLAGLLLPGRSLGAVGAGEVGRGGRGGMQMPSQERLEGSCVGEGRSCPGRVQDRTWRGEGQGLWNPMLVPGGCSCLVTPASCLNFLSLSF